MGVVVRIPTPLRRMTNGQDKVEMEASNLVDMIEKLESSYPGFKERLIDENGELRYPVCGFHLVADDPTLDIRQVKEGMGWE